MGHASRARIALPAYSSISPKSKFDSNVTISALESIRRTQCRLRIGGGVIASTPARDALTARLSSKATFLIIGHRTTATGRAVSADALSALPAAQCRGGER